MTTLTHTFILNKCKNVLIKSHLLAVVDAIDKFKKIWYTKSPCKRTENIRFISIKFGAVVDYFCESDVSKKMGLFIKCSYLFWHCDDVKFESFLDIPPLHPELQLIRTNAKEAWSQLILVFNPSETKKTHPDVWKIIDNTFKQSFIDHKCYRSSPNTSVSISPISSPVSSLKSSLTSSPTPSPLHSGTSTPCSLPSPVSIKKDMEPSSSLLVQHDLKEELKALIPESTYKSDSQGNDPIPSLDFPKVDLPPNNISKEVLPNEVSKEVPPEGGPVLEVLSSEPDKSTIVEKDQPIEMVSEISSQEIKPESERVNNPKLNSEKRSLSNRTKTSIKKYAKDKDGYLQISVKL